MASVAVMKRAHLTAQVRTVENQCVVSGHSKTWFMTSTTRTAVALQLPNHRCLFPTARTFRLMLVTTVQEVIFGIRYVKEEQVHFGTSIRRPECLRKDTPHH
jgi:hypothetical protein